MYLSFATDFEAMRQPLELLAYLGPDPESHYSLPS
jgi:hypothetical protein